MLVLKIDGNRVLRELDGRGTPLPQPSGDHADVFAALADWTARYRRAAVRDDDGEMHAVGTEMLDWLDADSALTEWLHRRELRLEIRSAPTADPASVERLLEAPWELLCRKAFLAAAADRHFVVYRRCSPESAPPEPLHGDLRMMFMAAAPKGQAELDFEAEEASILEATRAAGGSQPLAHVVVEESGALEFLAERLDGRDGAFEALHVSCHGDIAAAENEKTGKREGPERPILLFETVEGAADEVEANDLFRACGTRLPPLVFLSACRTAQRGGDGLHRGAEGRRRDASPFGGGPAEAPAEPAPELADPLAQALTAQVANVLGWDGSVYDRDAIDFARKFYGDLARGETVPAAAAAARRSLLDLRARDPERGRHWHFARVYLGPGGGGTLCAPGGETRTEPPLPPAFLDERGKRVPVAARAAFVGRRRAIQKALATFRAGPRGVLAHGMGNLGKSSLAARVASRMSGLRTAVVDGPVTERTVFAALRDAAQAMADEKGFAAGDACRTELDAMEQALSRDPGRFEAVIGPLLTKTFKDTPILLVLDDFERALEQPTATAAEVVPKAESVAPLGVLLRAFGRAGLRSRLMITSRYDFALRVGAEDLTTPVLERLPLTPMTERERRKQWRAVARAEGKEAAAAAADETLVDRLLTASVGNPGLQDVLTRPLLAGDAATAEAAVATVEAFLERGEKPPQDQDAGDFFQRMAFDTYKAALTQDEGAALSAACVFSPDIAIPVAALTAAAGAVGVAAPEPAVSRLIALGLLDDHGLQAGWASMTPVPHAAANPLARPLAEDTPDTAAVAGAAFPDLTAAWRDAEGDFPPDRRGVEAARIGLEAPSPDPSALDAAAVAGTVFFFRRADAAEPAVELVDAAIARLITLGARPSAVLLGHGIKAAERMGAVAQQEAWLASALSRNDIDPIGAAVLKSLQTERLVRTDEIEAAYKMLTEDIRPVFVAHQDARNTAVTDGRIADILQMRGDLDGALALLIEDALPVFEALDDRREIDATKGRIADILQMRGDLDGALALHLERLPIAEAMQDKDSRAHILFSCSKIRLARDERAGDDLRAALQELMESFRINLDLGRAEGIAVVGDVLGRVLADRGQAEQAAEAFDLSAAAYRKLGRDAEAARVDAQRAALQTE